MKTENAKTSARQEHLQSIFTPAELEYLNELPTDERNEIVRQRNCEVAARNMGLRA